MRDEIVKKKKNDEVDMISFWHKKTNFNPGVVGYTLSFLI